MPIILLSLHCLRQFRYRVSLSLPSLPSLPSLHSSVWVSPSLSAPRYCPVRVGRIRAGCRVVVNRLLHPPCLQSVAVNPLTVVRRFPLFPVAQSLSCCPYTLSIYAVSLPVSCPSCFPTPHPYSASLFPIPYSLSVRRSFGFPCCRSPLAWRALSSVEGHGDIVNG